MLRKFITRPSVVIVLLILQIIPLLMFPPATFNPATQEWWLPVLLAIFAIVAITQLILRRSTSLWPWYLVSFSQGFNIISRLMLFMPHATKTVNDSVQIDGLYIILSVISILISAIYILIFELPDMRMSLYSHKNNTQPA
jgi:bacteriorhodopsin